MNIFNDLNKVNINENTVVTIGNFDGVHIGHADIINRTISKAKEKELRSLLFTFSNHPVNFFRKESIKNLMTIKEKYNFIKDMGMDIFIHVPFDESIIKLTPEEYVIEILVKKLKAKEVVIGHDFRFGKNRSGNAQLLKEYGEKYKFNVIVVEPIKVENIRVSSTIIRTLLEDGKVSEIKNFLGRYYSISGIVVHGKKLGRKLGFPTANLQIDSDKLIPKCGIYYTKVKVKDKIYDGATNIGYNPTIENKGFSIETHIIDFNEHLYEQKISIEFIKRIRDEIKFSSVNELKKQLNNDIESIKMKKNIYL